MKYLFKISRIQFKKVTLVQGTMLYGKNDSSNIEGIRPILSSYLKKPCANCIITIVIGSNKFQTKTNEAGTFQIKINQEFKGELNFLDENNVQIPICQSYPHNFQESDYGLSIISDLDDTVLVSHTRNIVKRITTILFAKPSKRIAIGFTQNLLNVVSKLGGDVYYVSKSETNLFGILSTFLQKNNLPIGNLFLTKYLRFSQLLNPKKGIQYKEQIIESIINSTTGKQFILIGDDTQNDVLVYSNIIRKYSKSIYKVYIRKTIKNKIKIQPHHLHAIEELNIPFLYFDDNQEIEEELNSITKTFES